MSEAGWLNHHEHAIQAHVLARWAARMGVSLDEAVELRVWRHSRPRRWVRALEPECAVPTGWPARLSWLAHADDCRLLFANADAFLRDEVADPCPRARGWRRPGPALEEALRLGRARVWCGRTGNAYVR